MEGLMQDYELSIQHVLWRLERLHGKSEVVTKREQGVHRNTYADLVPRVNRLAGALKRLGVKPGDRVATLSWNNYRHLELYYAVPCMGAVLHTLNLRLFPEHLDFVDQGRAGQGSLRRPAARRPAQPAGGKDPDRRDDRAHDRRCARA